MLLRLTMISLFSLRWPSVRICRRAIFGQQSAQKFARAQWDQLLPSISALSTIGSVPVRTDQYYVTNWWGAVGVNLNIPIFNGFLYSSEAKEAVYRSRADEERTRDLRDQIVRDVRTAWLQANTAYQRIGVTAQLLKASKFEPATGADPLPAWTQFDRGTQPGATAADQRRD